MGLKFYYQFLSASECNIYREIVKGIEKRKKSIRVLGNGKQTEKILNFVYYDYPEFFYVDTTKTTLQTSTVTTMLQIGYHKNKEQIKEIEQKLEIVSMQFLDKLEKTKMDNLSLIRYVHNFIIKNTEYAMENKEHGQVYGDVSSIHGVFLNHKALCKGIALATKWLLDKAGIMSAVMEGRMIDQDSPRLKHYTGSCNEINHAWNLVCVNDAWHFMDVTMDLGRSKKGWICYDYFLRNKEIFDAYVQYRDLYVSCKEELYSYFVICKVAFSDKEILKKYLAYCKKKHKKRIYFQLKGEASKIGEEQIIDLVGQYITGECRYRVNKKLYIYDIFISEERI